jgi:hypothetical protein
MPSCEALSSRRGPRAHHAQTDRAGLEPCAHGAHPIKNSSIHVLDDGARAVSAAGGFRVPLALVILILDSFRVAGEFLLLGGRSRRSERLGMSREGFRKHPVDFKTPR